MKDFLKVYGLLIAVAIAGVLIALSFVDPAPPSSISFAVGSKGGAYAAYGERYKAILAKHGVKVDLIHTAGSVANYRFLNEKQADVALVQGGLASSEDREALRSLGGLFYEPFWVFVQDLDPVQSFADLKFARIAIGAKGSGTRQLAQALQADLGNDWQASATLELSGQDAASALLEGDIDAAVYSAGISAPYIQKLLENESVRALSFKRAAAISRRRPALAKTVLLEGVVDMAKNVPNEDVQLIASVTQLAINKDLHPAIVSILLDAATKIHTQHSLLAPAGVFPDSSVTDLPLSDEARRFYSSGPTFLRRVFPFWVASFFERAWILAIPLLTLLLPLIRAAPPVYRWRVSRKIYVMYADLRDLETRGRTASTPEALNEVRRQVDTLQEEIGRVEVPLSYTDDLYRLRSHVAFVGQLLSRLEPAASRNIANGS